MQRESNWRIYLTIIVTLVCLIAIWPTLRYTYFVFNEKAPDKTKSAEQEKFTKEEAAFEKKRADLQRKSIKMGLDLLGGVDVLLKVDEDKMRESQLESNRENIRRGLEEKNIAATIAPDAQKTGLILTLNDKANAQQAANYLADYAKRTFESFDVADFKNTGKVDLKLSNGALQNTMRDSIESAQKTVRERVDKFGVTQPSVSVQNQNSIRVQVPGEKDPEYVISQIIRPAQLEFYLLHDNNDSEVQKLFELVPVEDSHGKKVDTYRLRAGQIIPAGFKAMSGEDVKHLPNGQTKTVPMMYIVKRAPEMTGKNLVDAYVQTNTASLENPVTVGISFNPAGAHEFGNVTKNNINKRLAIALDGKIYSAPNIRTAIPNGQAVIEGSFTPQDARDLALVLKAGAMPAELKAAEKRAIGPTLGAQSIKDSLRALVIAAICITVFMIFYYSTAGFIAIIALVLNLLLVFACMSFFNATITLSGIGGIILTLAMAVDTNVLIYERMREELEFMGKDLKSALRAGFHRVLPVIVDSHLTALMSAFALLQFGKGSVQGFALTMSFGLIANLFTGLTVTYAICTMWFKWRGKLSLGVLHIFKHANLDFIGLRWVSFSISGALLLLGVAIMIYPGPQYAVDFKGGVMTEVKVNNADPKKDVSEDLVKALDAAGLSGDQARVQRVQSGEANHYLIRAGLQMNPDTRQFELPYTENHVKSALETKYTNNGISFLSVQGVSEEVGQGFKKIALVVVLATSACILVYLWFRFEAVFGMAAVLALLHDLIVTIGLITLFKVQISLDIVSALMILLGFSVNDTIVIFDRIRENSHTMPGRSFKDICNNAMNRTLSRTLITSLTAIGVMVVLYFVGGYSLQGFALTLIIGMTLGTYSSDFIAAPLVFMWNEYRKGEVNKMLGTRKVSKEAEDERVPVDATLQPASGPALNPTVRRGRR